MPDLDLCSRDVPMAEPVEVSTLPDLAGRLREAREALGLTQQDVAEVLFVVHSTVSNWERGAAAPPLGLSIGWCRLVGLPLWVVPENREGGS